MSKDYTTIGTYVEAGKYTFYALENLIATEKLNDYRIVEATGSFEFETRVSELMNIGWKLLGAPQILKLSDSEGSDTVKFFQAMVRV